MIQLRVVVEGQTEEELVKQLVKPHLEPLAVYATPVVVMTKRERDGRKHTGGGDWDKWREEIALHCRDRRPTLRITTLFDLYGLPRNFPALDQHSRIKDTAQRVLVLEQEMAKAIGDARFIPYIQRHEFEALVLAGLPALADLLPQPRDRAGLRKLIEAIGDTPPEDINDGSATAPSKRLQSFIPSYNPGDRRKGEGKSLFGPMATTKTGLPTLRQKCPRFDGWITRLEQLSPRHE